MRKVFLILFISAAVGCVDRSANVGSNRSGGNTNTVSNAAETTTNVANSERVTIESPDKTIIVGSFFQSPNPKSSAVLLLHQWQSDRHSFDDFAKRMQAKGFNVLSIDGRGFGESTKTVDGKTVAPERTDGAVQAMLGDVGAAVDFLSKQKDVDPNRIGIVGASYGSSLALIYAANHPNIKSVALLSPGLNYFGNMQTEPASTKYGERALFMAASTEDNESADAVAQLGKVAGPPNSDNRNILVVTTGGHGTNLFTPDGRVVNALQDFLVKTLK